MSAPVTEIFQALCDAQYREDGVAMAVQDLARRIAQYEPATDDLDVTRTNTASATASAVGTTGAVNLYLAAIQAESAGFLQIFDDNAASTTAADMVAVLPCAATTTTVWTPYPRFVLASGMSISFTTTAVGTTAVGTLPTITLLYRTATTPLI